MFPTVVYQADSGNQTDIFLECPYDYCVPTRISCTSDNSHSPAIVFDDTGAVHVVWEESGTGRSSIIYYEAPNICDYSSSVTETLASWHDVYHRRPSISIFSTGLTVVWEAADPLSDTPYRIMRAVRSGGGFSVPEIIDSDWHELKNPSLDYAQGSGCEPFSAGWERHDEIFFNPLDSLFRANEYSDLPVIGNVPGYEYYYWEHDSGGFEDIYCDVCYWGAATMRWGHNFSEDFSAISPRCPSATGASVIWTEGDSAPYLVKYVDLGYAINIEELTSSRPDAFALSAYPNPFNSAVTIAIDGAGVCNTVLRVEIYDLAGRKIDVIGNSDKPVIARRASPDEAISSGYEKDCHGLRPRNDNAGVFVWTPDESLPSGVYLVRASVVAERGFDKLSHRDVGVTVATKRVVYLK